MEELGCGISEGGDDKGGRDGWRDGAKDTAGGIVAEELGCENCGGGDDVEGAGEGDRGEVGLWGSW